MKKAPTLLLGSCLSALAASGLAEVEVEYIGHASFALESPGGIRVVVDPFDSNRWLGYRFPDSVPADVVLVTHPHYDHDASYYWGDSVPVLREPGSYRVGDVTIVGVKGRHADPYGKDFEQRNTLFLLEAGGVRIAHLGDNGPLDEPSVRDLGRVDVLLIPIDGDDHILKRAEVAAIRRELGDPLVIPMHYRLEGFLGLPRSLGPIDPWLEGEAGVVRSETNRARLSRARAPERKVLVLKPSPELKPWGRELAQAWDELDEARQIAANQPTQLSQAAALVKRAAKRAGTILFSFHWGETLARMGREDEARRVLEEALSRAARDDREFRMRAHALLAELYEKQGTFEKAREHHRIVLEGSYRTELRDRARRFLEKPTSH